MGTHRYGILHLLPALIACLILLGVSSPSTFAQSLGEVEAYEAEAYDIILEVKRDRKTLAKAIFGLEKNNKYYIPIEELARLVNFNAKTSLSDGTVSGFFFSEENSFTIDTKQNTYTLRGETVPFAPTESFVFTQQLGIGDIYVTADLLNKIWPLDLSLDTLKQTLEIQTKRKLPYELSADRQRKRNNQFNKNSTDQNVNLDLPRINNDYKMFSLPAIDVSSNTQIGGSEDGIGQNINIRGRNDLLKAQASYNFSFDKEQGKKSDFNNARFVLEKKSYDEGDLPLNLQLMQAGDIRPRPSRLIDGVLVGRGFLVSTEPQKQIRDFDQITVEGEAEPGWEVELYRGNELIDFQVVDNQGEYRFENVSLNYNTTIIKTILYGPEGQVRESEETYSIADSMLKPGKTIIEASALDLNRDLIPVRDVSDSAPTGFAQNVKVKRGIKSWLTAFTSFTRTPTRDGEDRNYGTLGVDVYFKGISGLAEVYKDLSGGTAYDLRAATNVQGVNINLRNAIFSDFQSEEANFGGTQRTSRTELSLSKPFQMAFGSFGLRFKLDNQRFKETAERTQLDFSQTFAKSKLRVTHGNTINLTDRSHQNSDGRINATYRINNNWQLRSLLNYNIYPERRLRNLLSEIRYKDGKKFTAALDVNRNFQDQGTQFGAQVAYDFEKFRLGLNTDWEKDNGFRSFLRATFSMAPYGINDSYIFSSKNLSNRAALNGHVFLDKNYDGEYNGSDETIDNAVIDIGRRETDPTNEYGIGSYIGSPKSEYENITLNVESLEDPFSVSTNPGYNGLLRPATSTFVQFPVIQTGLIEGTIETDEGPLAGVRFELLQNNEVIETTSSAFDGYYTFEYIEPGEYTVRIDPSYEQLNIPPRPVLVTSENLFQNDIDFQIFEQAAEVVCVDEANDNGRITQKCHASTTQGGIQPAHSYSHWVANAPTIQNLHITEDSDQLVMVFEFDKKPNDYKIIETYRKKEISLILPNSNWKVKEKWKSTKDNILKAYAVEHLPNGDTKVILKAVNKIYVKDSETNEPDGTSDNEISIIFSNK